jgi:hypothetical protein
VNLETGFCFPQMRDEDEDEHEDAAKADEGDDGSS